MAEIVFNDDTLKSAKSGIGMYASLKREPKPVIVKKWRHELFNSIEMAFREYAKQHKGCTTKIENEAWKRFERKLKKYL